MTRRPTILRLHSVYLGGMALVFGYLLVNAPWHGGVLELSLTSMAGQWSFAAIVLGLICGGLYRRIAEPGRPDVLLHLAWSIALMFIIAWPSIIILVAHSAGYAPESFYYLAILVIAFAVGVALGLWNYLRERRTSDVRPHPMPMTRRPTILRLHGVYLGGMALAFGYLLVNAPRQGDVVELPLTETAVKWSFAAIVLGLVCGGSYRQSPKPGRPDLLMHLAWPIALMLMIAWPAIVTLAVLSAGYAQQSYYAAILVVAVAVGVALGLWNYLRERRTSDVRPHPTDLPHPRTSAASVLSSQAARHPGGDLFGLTLGILGAFLIAAIAFCFSSIFRGPMAGFSTLGTVMYKYDQRPIEVATGAAVLTSGWLLAWGLKRNGFRPSLANGLRWGCTALGTILALRN